MFQQWWDIFCSFDKHEAIHETVSSKQTWFIFIFTNVFQPSLHLFLPNYINSHKGLCSASATLIKVTHKVAGGAKHQEMSSRNSFFHAFAEFTQSERSRETRPIELRWRRSCRGSRRGRARCSPRPSASTSS